MPSPVIELDWERFSIAQSDESFPFVERIGGFDIRLELATPFGFFLNKVAERLNEEKRYCVICYVESDAIRAEGYLTRQEARDVVRRMELGADGNYHDPLDERSSEEILLATIESLKSRMNTAELEEIEKITSEYTLALAEQEQH